MHHILANVNKNGQLSSYAHIFRVAETFVWWTYIHAIELLMFCFIPNTPVTVWMSMQRVFEIHKDAAPTRCLTIYLCEIANDLYGGVCNAPGHRHVPSCGRSMPVYILYWSLRNLMNLVTALSTTSDTDSLYKMAQKPARRGGVQGVGPLISTHAVCIPVLAGYSHMTHHVDHCVVAEGNMTAKRLEENYDMSKQERAQALKAILPLVPELPTLQLLEEAGCAMGRFYYGTADRYLDTYFYNQKLYFVKDGKVHSIDANDNVVECGLSKTFLQWMQGNGKTPPRLFEWWRFNGDYVESDFAGDVYFTKNKVIRENSTPIGTSLKSRKSKLTPAHSSVKGAVCRRRQLAKIKKPDDIVITRFKAQTRCAIFRRLGKERRSNQRRNKVKNFRHSHRKVDDEDYIPSSCKRPRDARIPCYSTIVSSGCRIVDLMDAIENTLDLPKRSFRRSEYLHTHEVKVKGSPKSCWDCRLDVPECSFSISLSSVDFCFDLASSRRCDKGYMLYHSKKHAEDILLLKAIVCLRPDYLRRWMNCNDVVVIWKNDSGGKLRPSEPCAPIDGWFILFKVKKSIYAVDCASLSFNEDGSAKEHCHSNVYQMG